MERTAASRLGADALRIDCEAEVEKISRWMVDVVGKALHRRGVIIALSGGVDSSVCGALAVRALGKSKVYGLLLPEHDSSRSSADLGAQVAQQLGIAYRLEHIGPTLEAIGCYRWRDEAMCAVFPDYALGWKSKIAIAGGAQGRMNFFKLVVQSPAGEVFEKRLPAREYLQIVSATNYKQRIRKTVEYFHADRLNYAVIGTPNRLEYDQGFFVKNGDGAADIKPIAHLYKTQVYALARHLGLPDAVCNAMPTTDTYSMSQGQDEFYFALPYQQMDIALWAHNHQVTAAELADALSIDEAQARFIYADIEAKRRTTQYLHARPMLVEPVHEAGAA
ncbi:MAG: NAD(+) synthase [Rhizobacter sp.]|nr:NAD(+) synthase [Rhizobacter sp.]